MQPRKLGYFCSAGDELDELVGALLVAVSDVLDVAVLLGLAAGGGAAQPPRARAATAASKIVVPVLFTIHPIVLTADDDVRATKSTLTRPPRPRPKAGFFVTIR